MMITIHGLAPQTKYQDVKLLIKQECNIDDFILDNLVPEGDGTKKVRVGLPDENEGYKLMKCLNGYRVSGTSVLKVVPIGKPALNPNIAPQGGYDSRAGYQNQPRNDFPNQRGDYINQPGPNDYNRGPHGSGGPRGAGGPLVPGGPHGTSGPHVPGGPQGPHKPYGAGGPHSQGPMDNGRPSPWTANSGNSNQWSSNAMAGQIPQNTFKYGSGPQANSPGYNQQHPSQGPHSRSDMRSFDQGRQGPPADQGYGGFPPKNAGPQSRLPDVRHNLRSVDTIEGNPSSAPMHGGRYPPNQYPQDKPVTIMKDNFQGPTQFNINHPDGHQQQFPQQSGSSPWQQGHQVPPKPILKSGPMGYDKGFDDRKYPQDHVREPKDQSKPDTYKEYEKRRGFSPSGRDPMARRVSPPGRREDPRDLPGRAGDIGQRIGDPMQRRVSPQGRRDDPHMRRDDPHVRRDDPHLRRDDTHVRREDLVRNEPLLRRDDPHVRNEPLLRRDDPHVRNEPLLRRDDPLPRRDDPHMRRDDPHLRRDDPLVRRDDPHARRDDPHARRDDPHERREDPHGRRFSPPRKRTPPGERRPVAGVRHESPAERPAPAARRLASPRRDERPPHRFSPGRHHPDKVDKYGADPKDLKKIRPAYEPVASHAPNQAMYSSGYRPNVHENVQYPAQGIRQEQPGPWQRHEPSTSMKKPEDDRRDSRMPLARDRLEEADKHFSAPRKSRSPIRRDRSPVRDRFKRTSPSPRSSYSPRRSWALEKRRSPDAPPPPSWPGQNADLNRPGRPNFPEKDEKPKHQPVWEPRVIKEDDVRNRRPDDRRQYEEAKIRIAKDLMERPPVSQTAINDRYPREPKFSPRDDYDDRRDNYRRRDSPDRKPHRDEFDLPRKPRDDNDDYNRRRESPRRDRKPDIPKDIDKDFEDIYNRAVQFKKKAEEFRKSGSKKREDFEDDRRHFGETDRDDMRQRYEDRPRYRDEELLRREREERHEDRPRDDRLRDDRLREERLRDERPRDDRPRHEDDRRDYHQRDQHSRAFDKAINDDKPKRFAADDSIRQKRVKAIEEISTKIIDRSDEYKHVEGEQRHRIFEELKVVVSKIIDNMFGEADVSFIEMIIKYQAKYTVKDEMRMLQDVMRSLPKQFRVLKRHPGESSGVPAKTSRLSPNADLKTDPGSRPKLSDSNFNVNLAPPSVINLSCLGATPTLNQSMVPVMVSAPFYQTFDSLQQDYQNQGFGPKPVPPVADFMPPVQQVVEFSQPVQPPVEFLQPMQPASEFSQPTQQRSDMPSSYSEDDHHEGYRLYLCKDDFERITNAEADLLKDFLISQMFMATTHYQGWSPDFTLKGLQSLFRYEVVTKDEGSKNWLLNLDFSEFAYFNVLVYTKEELWYERAAIWLPGHSRVKNIEPLDKIKLQNKKLEGVNVSKWKFVKKIVNEKGTRLYVDMPPSSARALEVHEMKLSYELQQVNVYLKAVAVDKDSFDTGMKTSSLTTPAEIEDAIKNAPMPVLTNDPALVKIILKGSKTLDLVQARKIKEVVIHNLFRYHQQDGLSRTDFVKFGFLQPNFFAILPLNSESKRWLLGCSFGKVNRQAVVVIGGEEDNTRFIKMFATVPYESQLRTPLIVERFKTSNQGVKGINYHKWKSIRLKPVERKRVRYEVEIDMASLETLSKMKYQLDYVDRSGLQTVYFRSEYSQSGLEDMIRKCKAEMMDTYDIANMDLGSDQSDSETNKEVICLD